MTASDALSIMREALMVAARIAAPILLMAMLVGIIISIFQAATQIHEQTISFVPKLIVIVVVLIGAGAWMMELVSDFARRIFLLMQG